MKSFFAVPITAVTVMALLLVGWVCRTDPDSLAAERGQRAQGPLPAPRAAERDDPATSHPELADDAASSIVSAPTRMDEHVRKLRDTLPDESFHVVVQPPFVVIGDEEETVVRQRATGTIQWAVDRLKRDFFKKDPQQIINIWLFKDKESYRTHSLALFDNEPDTPFGYYSPRNRAIVMNISTGTGTLVHEIVHPFMAANFPECPAWFNEGLASLYEQCRDRRQHIWGLTNWRLKGLQEAIRSEEGLPSFESLCLTTDHEFYTQHPGRNYAQARYLCYFLQERGQLVDFYHQLHRGQIDDPGGYKTLVRILGEDDMLAFQKRWEQYVLGLVF